MKLESDSEFCEDNKLFIASTFQATKVTIVYMDIMEWSMQKSDSSHNQKQKME